LKIKIDRTPDKEVLPIEWSWLPGQDDYRTFCMSEEAEEVYQKLEEIINT